MPWTRVLVLCLLTSLLILTFSSLGESAAVQNNRRASADSKGVTQKVFMPESEASNFFKRRSRRSPKYHAELLAEQRVRQTADEHRREHNEEQRDEFENYVEEERDEQTERTRETNEQYREYHYDGLQPQRYWFH